MLKQKNSKKQGDVGLGLAIAFFASKGWTVSIPLTDSQSYDLLIDDGKISRVQVKTTTQKGKAAGTYVVELRTLGGNQSFHTVKKFSPESVDFLFVVTDDGSKYFIPSSSIAARSMLTIGEYSKEFQV